MKFWYILIIFMSSTSAFSMSGNNESKLFLVTEKIKADLGKLREKNMSKFDSVKAWIVNNADQFSLIKIEVFFDENKAVPNSRKEKILKKFCQKAQEILDKSKLENKPGIKCQSGNNSFLSGDADYTTIINALTEVTKISLDDWRTRIPFTEPTHPIYIIRKIAMKFFYEDGFAHHWQCFDPNKDIAFSSIKLIDIKKELLDDFIIFLSFRDQVKNGLEERKLTKIVSDPESLATLFPQEMRLNRKIEKLEKKRNRLGSMFILNRFYLKKGQKLLEDYTAWIKYRAPLYSLAERLTVEEQRTFLGIVIPKDEKFWGTQRGLIEYVIDQTEKEGAQLNAALDYINVLRQKMFDARAEERSTQDNSSQSSYSHGSKEEEIVVSDIDNDEFAQQQNSDIFSYASSSVDEMRSLKKECYADALARIAKQEARFHKKTSRLKSDDGEQQKSRAESSAPALKLWLQTIGSDGKEMTEAVAQEISLFANVFIAPAPFPGNSIPMESFSSTIVRAKPIARESQKINELKFYDGFLVVKSGHSGDRLICVFFPFAGQESGGVYVPHQILSHDEYTKLLQGKHHEEILEAARRKHQIIWKRLGDLQVPNDADRIK